MIAPPTLARATFDRLRRLIKERTGISLGDNKVQLVQSRLLSRLQALELSSFEEYVERVSAARDADELRELTNAITTNKTSFFREEHHFEALRAVIERAAAAAARGRPRTLRVWSAACSTGEEPYSIAITLLDALGAEAPRWDVKILATDIDTDVLATGARGVYAPDRLEGVPEAVAARWFVAGKGPQAGLMRARRPLRALITWRVMNFVEVPWPVRGPFDAIFCRNVLIYFERTTQHDVVTRLVERLAVDGELYLGHSESLVGSRAGLRSLGRTAFTHGRPGDVPSAGSTA